MTNQRVRKRFEQKKEEPRWDFLTWVCSTKPSERFKLCNFFTKKPESNLTSDSYVKKENFIHFHQFLIIMNDTHKTISKLLHKTTYDTKNT